MSGAKPSDLSLTTERLILRPHRPADIALYAPLWTAPLSGPAWTPVLDEEGAWARLLRLVGHRAAYGFGPFVVEERATGAIVGEVGLARFRRGMGPRFDAAPEAMWIVAAEARGRGYAGEAAAAALAAFDAAHPATPTVCMIDPDNTASLRLAARLGFARWGHGDRHGKTVVLLERPGR